MTIKHHYGEKFVPRIAKKKWQARTKKERQEIQQQMKVGRRMERRTTQQQLKKIANEWNKSK